MFLCFYFFVFLFELFPQTNTTFSSDIHQVALLCFRFSKFFTLLTKLSSTFTKLGLNQNVQTGSVKKLETCFSFGPVSKFKYVLQNLAGGLGGWPPKKKKRTVRGSEGEMKLELPHTIY